MPHFIWQRPQWPALNWDSAALLSPLADCRKRQGMLLEKLRTIGLEDNLRTEAAVLEEDAIQTSAIEGESLDRERVRSSVATHLGLAHGGLRPADRATHGLVQILLDATRNHNTELTAERLWAWHTALFPSGYSNLRAIVTGAWRDQPLEVVSGPVQRHRTHFTAPPPETLDTEMKNFLRWWREGRTATDGILRAGVAHLLFVTIHPFEDGNGRLARTLTDMAMAQDEGLRTRHYSLSAQIMRDRESYYDILEQTQRGDGDVTAWLLWFLDRTGLAIAAAHASIARVLLKADFWREHALTEMNERQRKAVNRLLDAGPEELGDGFEGGLTNRKYMGMTRCSRATAYREITDLVAKGVLLPRAGGGRSTAYDVAWPETMPETDR